RPALPHAGPERGPVHRNEPGSRQGGAGHDGQDPPGGSSAPGAARRRGSGEAAQGRAAVRADRLLTGRRHGTGNRAEERCQMKRARFVYQGRLHWGTVADDGTLLDEAGRAVPADEVVWLPPVEPRKVLAVALNYADHAEELGMKRPVEPVVFLKPPSSLIGHRSPVLYPRGATYMHYEGELAVVMGAPCRRVSPERALDYVRGWTAANDITVRDF